MGRRGSHEGSIYQRADGRWVASVSAGYADGKRRRHVAYGETRAEARQRLAELVRQTDEGRSPPPAALTVARYLHDWLDGSRPRLRASSWAAYEIAVRARLVPALGHTRLASLTAAEVRRMMAELEAAGVGARTRDYALVTLKVALARAVRDGILGRNVAAAVERPRLQRREMPGLSPSDAHAVMDAVATDALGPMYLAMLGVGLRLGEASGLRWADVDLEGASLSVRHALVRVPRPARAAGADRLVLADPKTRSSVRTVALPAFVVAGFHEQRRRQLAQRLLVGEGWEDRDYVFAGPFGGPVDPRRVHRRLRELLLSAGLPPMRVHDLRHAAASAMLAAGVPIRTVADTLGHADVRTTLGVYAHTVPELAREAAHRMDEYVAAGSA